MAFSKRVRIRILSVFARGLALTVLPLAIAWFALDLSHHSLDIPFDYKPLDQIWQFTLTKAVLDTGWILHVPYLGAPAGANWFQNPAPQTSALHSVLLWVLGFFLHDAVLTQQVYYLLNFPLIAVTAYLASRALKVHPFVAVCVGLCYAFLPTRFFGIYYAYLGNYFVVPLAVLPPIWILVGEFARPCLPPGLRAAVAATLRHRPFLAALAIIVLVALTDGYYAFFTLLLLGFATGLRLLTGDLRLPAALIAPILLIMTIGATALTLDAPLALYHHAHPQEFAPGGKPDPSLIRHDYEAEVYSTSLKIMLAPMGNHRIPAIGRFGARVQDTYTFARRGPANQFAAPGTLASLLLVATFILAAASLARGRALIALPGLDTPELAPMLGALIALALFVFATSIAGGIGPIIALVYPRIRAYDRFPLFLTMLLYLGAALVVSAQVKRNPSHRRTVAVLTATALVTALSLLDEIPGSFTIGAQADQYRAESSFVQQIERALPDGAEIYQYPYSQYLTNNRYYGWGAYAQIRLYLHSRHLHWSNGASKNEPVDLWHSRMSDLPIGTLVTEMQAAGFRGFIIDRTVVPDAEYQMARAALVARTGQQPLSSDDARLAFWPLADPGYTVEYNAAFTAAERIVVRTPDALATEPLSATINRRALLSAIDRLPPGHAAAFDHTRNADVFAPPFQTDPWFGDAPIASAASLRADLSCSNQQAHTLSILHDTLTLTLTNPTTEDWRLNSGLAPLRVGIMELVDPHGVRLRWDGGFRAPSQPTDVPAGTSVVIPIPLQGVDIKTGVPSDGPEPTAVFEMVQEGVAWFHGAQCRVRLGA